MGRKLKGSDGQANTLKDSNTEANLRYIPVADRGENNHWNITPAEMNKRYIVTHTTAWEARLETVTGMEIGDWIQVIKHPDSTLSIPQNLDNSYANGYWNGEVLIFLGSGNGVGGSSWGYFVAGSHSGF